MSCTASRKPHHSATPAPVADAPGSPTIHEGREPNGRFAKGNKGGPGNPFARQTAALRKQLVEAVTPAVMAQICTALILRAQGGNLAAIKLLFSYVIGKPTDAVNPDTLDHEEMEQYRREVGMDEVMGQVLLSMPADFACECVRTARPDILDRLIEKAARGGVAGAEAEDGEDAPSANGANGETEGSEPPAGAGGGAPMANGEIGAGEGADEPVRPAARSDVEGAARTRNVNKRAGEGAPMANGGNRRAPAAGPGPADSRPQRIGGTRRDSRMSAEPRQAPPGVNGGQGSAAGGGRRGHPPAGEAVHPQRPPSA